MQNERSSPLPTKKSTRSPVALQVNSKGRVDIQVKTIRVERDRQSVVLELHYSTRQARGRLQSHDDLVEDDSPTSKLLEPHDCRFTAVRMVSGFAT